MTRRFARWAWLAVTTAAAAQGWPDANVRTHAGLVATDQAVRDAGADSLVLVVASHPDDRYVLPAVWLRREHGLRVAVLLATRGGGAQNIGPETGDALERIRTLETEAGCAAIDAEVWYLDRPDAGYRRSAEETFAEWGRSETLRDLARLLRQIRPDAVMTTHHAEEQHGHDLALVELLPEAVALARDPRFEPQVPPHAIGALLLGAGSTPTGRQLQIDVDRLDRGLGLTLRRHAYEILRTAHRSPGPPAPLDGVFEPLLRLEPQGDTRLDLGAAPGLGLPSAFDAARWPGDPARAPAIRRFLAELPGRVARAESVLPELAQCLVELRGVRAASPPPDAAVRLDRRITALEQLLLRLAGLQIEVEVPPGAMVVAGEELVASVQVHSTTGRGVRWRVEGIGGIEAAIQRESDDDSDTATERSRAAVILRAPYARAEPGDPMAQRFRSARFVPPVRLRFHLPVEGIEVPVPVTVPVEQRPPVELQVVPRMLLLPSARRDLQFSVGITRNSQFPVEGELEVRGAAGYAIARDRLRVSLRDQRSDMFGFDVQVSADRRPGVDVLRIRLGANRLDLPVHKIDVRVPAGLRVGVVRSRDDTLSGVLGAGGLGVDWSDLSDSDLVVADLSRLDTIVVDIRALRDRPAVRNGFRRLLEFATGKGRRLVVFYQKDVEFHPPGEAFLGAPHLPFLVGKGRVTRADAPVRVLAPTHALLNHPNTIQPRDWDGWEQERGLYLPSAWASQYEELLEIRDPGQPAERGALLYARTGDGEYVYCALSLWRQLKKLHSGAVRLLANLLTPSGRT